MLTSFTCVEITLLLTLLAMVTLTALCSSQAKRQRKPLELAYPQKNALMQEFVRQT